MKTHRHSKTPVKTHHDGEIILSIIGLAGTALQVAIVMFAILLLTESNAMAYADPGSGALLWQLLAASLCGGMFYFRKLVQKFRHWRGRGGNEGEKPDKAASE